MSPVVALSTARLKRFYERDASEYCGSLPLEHFMESIEQSTQRNITVSSLALVRAVWPEFQVFSELMIQYVAPGKDPYKPLRIVPDNMVLVHSEPIDAHGSYATAVQPVLPILVLEYVSRRSKGKDYEDNRKKYERDLKIPYYLLFDPEAGDMAVLHRVKSKYVRVKPNEEDRLPIPELELEVALIDGWARFWFRGELLPLPGDLLHSLNEERAARIAAERAAAKSEKQRITAERGQLVAEEVAAREQGARRALEAELARMKAELSKAQST